MRSQKTTTLKNPHSTRKLFDLDKVTDIVFDDIEKLLDSLDIKYSRSGKNYFAKCPVHAGSDNDRAICIYCNSKRWACWTRSCHHEYEGNVFGLVRGVLSARNGEEASFMEALIYIKDLYGLSPTKTETVEVQKEVDPNQDLYDIVKACKPKEETYVEVDGVPTIGSSPYFESRGFSKEVLEVFGVEDCLDKTSSMFNRAIIPIHSDDAKFVGYIARSTKSFILPKFLFSSGFNKSHHLYNFHRASESIVDRAAIVLVEGQGDVWRLREAGINNCVGIMGKELSEKQLNKLLRCGAATAVVLTDNDQAGRESKISIYRQLNRYFRVVFPKFTKKDMGEMTVDQVKEVILPQIQGLY